jgi:hypothetical protein
VSKAQNTGLFSAKKGLSFPSIFRLSQDIVFCLKNASRPQHEIQRRAHNACTCGTKRKRTSLPHPNPIPNTETVPMPYRGQWNMDTRGAGAGAECDTKQTHESAAHTTARFSRAVRLLPSSEAMQGSGHTAPHQCSPRGCSPFLGNVCINHAIL